MPANDSPLEQRLVAEHQSLARPLRTLVRRPLIACGEASTVAEAVALMQAQGTGSVVILDGHSHPVGILTERDLVGVSIDGGFAQPVAAVMTRDPLGLPGHTPAYEAALEMIDRRIRHVLVTVDDAVVGVVSERDLFSLQRLGLGEISLEVRLARDLESLQRLAERVRRLTRMLVDEGVAGERIMLFVSMLNDRVCQRIIELVRKRYQWERIGWCWLAFGSEGRLEQTFATDQDNGLIFESHGDDSPDAVRKQLLPFAREVNVALDACGYPLCKGNVMASNPDLCLSVAEWRAKMSGWLGNSDPTALLDAAICFDFRWLHGDARLASGLRDWFLRVMRSYPSFLRLMAQNALQVRPALGRWRDFVTEDTPEAPKTINLKQYGVRPFIEAARIMAFARGLPQTNTAERLRAVSAAGGLPSREAEAIIASLFFIQSLRLRHQAQLEKLDEDAANRINPETLHELDRRTLKESFRLARDLQSRLQLDFQL